MGKIRVDAPAKLNLHLHAGEKRPDGFHNIESLFLALAFGDTLYIETTAPALSLQIFMNWLLPDNHPVIPSIPPEKNIIFRAVELFRERTGYKNGLKITVEKRIPPGGGLGGGSSDAAAALLALNCMASLNDSDDINVNNGLLNASGLAELAGSAGSDVPFFIYNASAAWVSGRGERVVPASLPESFYNLSFVLVNNGFPSDTAEAYRQLDLFRKTCIPNVREENLAEKMRQSLSGPPCGWLFTNDFLPVIAAGDKNGAYREILSDLSGLGADFAGLSGSGSTCFGVFSDRKAAVSARKNLLKQRFFVIETFPLARRTIYCYN